jgi:hypothetical protein
MKSTNFANLTTISFVIPAVAVLLVFSPTTHAVMPAPDGGYAGNNTAEGTNALFRNMNGINNTAVGFRALFNIRAAPLTMPTVRLLCLTTP